MSRLQPIRIKGDDNPTIHDSALALADGTGSCIFALGGQCCNQAHYRTMTFSERVNADIGNLRKGVLSARAIVLTTGAATRIANFLDELLKDCTEQERRLNKLEQSAAEDARESLS
jgi:hypothetical protein